MHTGGPASRPFGRTATRYAETDVLSEVRHDRAGRNSLLSALRLLFGAARNECARAAGGARPHQPGRGGPAGVGYRGALPAEGAAPPEAGTTRALAGTRSDARPPRRTGLADYATAGLAAPARPSCRRPGVARLRDTRAGSGRRRRLRPRVAAPAG
jgi:hypothetical protein